MPMAAEAGAGAGIGETLPGLSFGIEHVPDLLTGVSSALSACSAQLWPVMHMR